MTHYTGIDMVEIARIKKVIARWEKRFLNRIYTDNELRLYGKSLQSLAARFAGKEAVMKLLGTGRRGVSWRDIEVLAHPSGKPFINLYDRAQSKAHELGLKEITISISHTKEYAIASAFGAS